MRKKLRKVATPTRSPPKTMEVPIYRGSRNKLDSPPPARKSLRSSTKISTPETSRFINRTKSKLSPTATKRKGPAGKKGAPSTLEEIFDWGYGSRKFSNVNDPTLDPLYYQSIHLTSPKVLDKSRSSAEVFSPVKKYTRESPKLPSATVTPKKRQRGADVAVVPPAPKKLPRRVSNVQHSLANEQKRRALIHSFSSELEYHQQSSASVVTPSKAQKASSPSKKTSTPRERTSPRTRSRGVTVRRAHSISPRKSRNGTGATTSEVFTSASVDTLRNRRSSQRAVTGSLSADPSGNLFTAIEVLPHSRRELDTQILQECNTNDELEEQKEFWEDVDQDKLEEELVDKKRAQTESSMQNIFKPSAMRIIVPSLPDVSPKQFYRRST